MTAQLYPWSYVAWDLARARGVDVDKFVSQSAMTDYSDDENRVLQERLNTQLATDLWKALCKGTVVSRSADGKPLPPPQPTDFTRTSQPLVWVEDINNWLPSVGWIDKWEPTKPLLAAPKVPRSHLQGEAILKRITELGYNPQALPEATAGRAGGVKSKVRKGLEKNDLFAGETVFDKAWEKLRRDGCIKDTK